jgi:hypothetical protein
LKVDIGNRMVREINPGIEVACVAKSLVSQEAFDAVIASDFVFGCVDRDSLRLILNELCTAYAKPYFDIASDILPGEPPAYGGRVCVAWEGHGCLVCFGELDVAEIEAELLNPEAMRDRKDIYGVPVEALGSSGPSVVSINGVVSSLGVTEFMLAVTGLRGVPRRLLRYRGHMAGVSVATEEPAPDCYYCAGLRGAGQTADLNRYLRASMDL